MRSYVNDQPIVNYYSCLSEILSHTDINQVMSHALKKRGFIFVGSITCYAFIQSTGLVNDHLLQCFCRQHNVHQSNKRNA
ncbi:MAG: DNA-3-methyladenine glycosylase I [Snodgrassella sp.]|nr:DNA-3-methyladenine glycosylase I [Snodgrassella sp.]